MMRRCKTMRLCFVLLTSCCAVLAHWNGVVRYPNNRQKRDAVGQLDILTNHAQPIHADVKIENNGVDNITPPIEKTEKDKPCPDAIMPSHIEEGTVFKVTAPQDVNVIYQGKSLRKSWPLTSQLDLVRSVTRIFTLAVLIVTAIVEFYPLIKHLFNLYN